MDKVLTIVIPTYNMERYLGRCLSSLIVDDDLMQDLEVLVINDGSKDKSSEIAHEFEQKYPKTFHVIDKENGNYGSCINRGLTEARGKYIKVLDADDWFDTKNFIKFLTQLQMIDVDCIMSDMQEIDERGDCVLNATYSLPKEEIFPIDDLLNIRYPEGMWMHCVTYSTENLRAINYHQTEGISYTDQEWIFLPMAICKTIYYFPKVVYYYLVGRNGQTVSLDVFRRNFWQEIKGACVMADEIKMAKNISTTAYNYLRERLRIRCYYIYSHFFVDFRMKICYREMLILEKKIYETEPQVYAALDNLYRIEPIKYHYVKHWREKNYPRSLWPFKIALWIGGLKRLLTK